MKLAQEIAERDPFALSLWKAAGLRDMQNAQGWRRDGGRLQKLT